MQRRLIPFSKMLALGDDNAERGYQQIIDTYREAKQWQKATDAAKEAVAKLPKDRDLKMVYAGATCRHGPGGRRPAIQVKSLLKGTPDDREVYISLAQMYSRLKRWPEAEAALDKANRSLDQARGQRIRAVPARLDYERQKKYDQAEETFRKILAERSAECGSAELSRLHAGRSRAKPG